MPNRERDDEITEPLADDVVGIGEDEDEFEDDEVEEDEEDDEALESASLTSEVGSEGGSPGEAVEMRSRRAGRGRGSEASETWQGGDREPLVRRDEEQ